MDGFLRKRAIKLFWAFFIVFAGLAGHLGYIQLYSGTELTRQAVSQQSQVVPLEVPPRGQILDRNLRPLTVYREVWRAAVFPAAVADKSYAAGILAKAIGLTVEQADVHLRGQARLINTDLTKEQAAILSSESLPGIMAVKVKLRVRKPELASHTLGYLGREGSAGWEGKMGIESVYDGELRGKTPISLIRAFFDGKGRYIQGLGIKIENHQPDMDRKDVVLTIDRDIQQVVEEVLDSSGILDGAAVVLDAETGDIVALASRPDFTLEPAVEFVTSGPEAVVYSTAYAEVSPAKHSFLNKSLLLYQPGSVFKMVVAAAALEEEIVKPETVFLCVGDKDEIVKCYEKGGHGLLTFAEAVTYSCNPVFARVGLQLGAEKLSLYAKNFGLGNAGIVGLRESSTLGRLQRIAQEYNLVNASLGQWPVEASAVQIAAMTAAVANDGVYIPPRLVHEVRNADGTVSRSINEGKKVRAVSVETAKTLQAMLENVTRQGTGWQAWIEPWGSAGKTGSAQVGSEKIDAWFSGYAPVKEPRYIATVLVNDGVSGGQTAAPVFRKIMAGIIKTKAKR